MPGLGWVGNVIIGIGLWKLGSKHRTAFIWTIAGEMLWVVNALLLNMIDLAFICLLFAVLAGRNWLLWADKKEKVAADDDPLPTEE